MQIFLKMNYIATISPEHNVVILDLSSLYSKETDTHVNIVVKKQILRNAIMSFHFLLVESLQWKIL